MTKIQSLIVWLNFTYTPTGLSFVRLILVLVLLQISAQLIQPLNCIFLFEFDMLNRNMKVLFVANKYFSSYL